MRIMSTEGYEKIVDYTEEYKELAYNAVPMFDKMEYWKLSKEHPKGYNVYFETPHH
jgi:hypothetical protein